MRPAVAVIVLAAMAVFCASKLQVRTAITEFLPAGHDARLASLSRQLADSAISRTMILTVRAPDTPLAVQVSRQFQRVLQRVPGVQHVFAGMDDQLQAAVRDLYFSRRHLFMSDQPTMALPRSLSVAGLQAAARRLKRLLASPEGHLVRSWAADDPLLAFTDRLAAMASEGGQPEALVQGRLLSGDRRHAVFVIRSDASAFATTTQRRLLDAIQDAFRRLNRKHRGQLRLEMAGVNRFAVASENAFRDDVRRVSIASIILLIALFVTLFRSPLYLLVGTIPLLAGMLSALTVTLAIWGHVHGLTLAFGATLIGVCIDYPTHFFIHHTLRPASRGPFASLQTVKRGLMLGGATTLLGMLCLIWANSPVLRQIGVFASVGVFAALLCTLTLVPALTPRKPTATEIQRFLDRQLDQLLPRMARHRRTLAIAVALAVLVGGAGAARLQWQDDLRALSPVHADLLAEDRSVRDRVSSMDVGRFVVAVGRNEQEALTLNDAAFAHLTRAREAKELGGFRSLHTFVWSASLQRDNWQMLVSDRDLSARLTRIFAQEGFTPTAFGHMAAHFSGPGPRPLSLADLEQSPLAPLIGGLHARLNDGSVAVVTLLRDVRDVDAVERRLAGYDGLYYLDHPRMLADFFGVFRVRTLGLVGVGLGLVLLAVWIAYRRITAAVVAVFPAILAAVTTLAALSVAGMPLNLLHVTTVILVLSMGVDYGVFLIEATRRRSGLGATVLSLLTACLSTVLSFGMLALSDVPALRAIGATAGLGVVLSLLLAPASLVLGRLTERST